VVLGSPRVSRWAEVARRLHPAWRSWTRLPRIAGTRTDVGAGHGEEQPHGLESGRACRRSQWSRRVFWSNETGRAAPGRTPLCSRGGLSRAAALWCLVRPQDRAGRRVGAARDCESTGCFGIDARLLGVRPGRHRPRPGPGSDRRNDAGTGTGDRPHATRRSWTRPSSRGVYGAADPRAASVRYTHPELRSLVYHAFPRGRVGLSPTSTLSGITVA